MFICYFLKIKFKKKSKIFLHYIKQEAIKARLWELTKTFSLENWKGLFDSVFLISHFSCKEFTPDTGLIPLSAKGCKYKCFAGLS